MPLARLKTGEFTYADYQRWPENQRWQLLDGQAHAMAPPSLDHQRVVVELGRQLATQLQGHRCEVFVAPVGVRLPSAAEADDQIRTVFEPDIVVVCDPAKLDSRGIRGAPDFIVEVLSPSTAGFDQVEKRLHYDRAGVRELWLLDTAGGVLTIYRQQNGSFAGAEIRRAEDVVAIAALAPLKLDLEFMRKMRVREED